MIKTLRITSILVGLAAIGFVVFIASEGMQTDDSIEQFLASPGIAEQMKGSSTVKNADSGQDSPLIRQAKAFSLRINPPPPPAKAPRKIATSRTKEPPRPKVQAVTANFTLLGTSSHLGDEGESWALINEVGKGVRWVKQGQSVGHLIIKGIGSGVVLIDDRGETYELGIKKEAKPNYVKSYSGILPEASPEKSWQTGNVRDAMSSGIAPEEPKTLESPIQTAGNLQENIEWLKQLQTDPEFSGLSGADANALGGLGEMLKSLEKDLETAENKQKEAEKKPTEQKKPAVKIDEEEEYMRNKSEKAGSDAEARKRAVEAMMKKRRSRTRR